MRHSIFSTVFLAALSISVGPSHAQNATPPGVSDTEIKIGNFSPYSGPASGYSTIAKAQAAYFKMTNASGGVNGRRIKFISYDDGYSPPKAVEQTRKLVEGDEVLLLFSTFGTASNSAIQKYVNQKRVPHLMIGSGAAKWDDPKNFPWSLAWPPNYQTEGRLYAHYILKNFPGKRVSVLYQNDDLGKDYLKGLNAVFGSERSRIVVSEAAYEVTSPNIDSQIVQLRNQNADIFLNFSTPKFAAQAIKKIAELDWHPVHIMSNISVSVSSVLKPAGFEQSKGIMSAAYIKDPNDPQWKDDPAMNEYREFMAKWYPEGDVTDGANIQGYVTAGVMIRILNQCGDDLSRENIMKQATSLDLPIPQYLPGIVAKTSPTDYTPIEQLRMMRFNGQSWELFGPMLSGDGTE
ncbi:ABC transporter substrate-binding protein [Bradyrhizobium vignae]|uniref:ABC transporter substrate-binding protein n=1 Tax=Bradyrhizobium vignae TaxID=1549949 RepID=UPI00100AE847|nr:ABC transporter substrate-binding protein [Bradyrhizobium vignae]RXH06660.1 branched-chain amino acid ABC transporter substrate-binding protein [Bradyrhizobium vignae]